VDVHVATPYGASRHLLIPAHRPDAAVQEQVQSVVAGEIAKLLEGTLQPELVIGEETRLVVHAERNFPSGGNVAFELHLEPQPPQVDFQFSPAIQPGAGADATLGVALRRGSRFVTPIIPVAGTVKLEGGHFSIDAASVFRAMRPELTAQLSTLRFDQDGKVEFSAYFYLSVDHGPGAGNRTHLPVRVTNMLPIDVRLLPDCCNKAEELPPPVPARTETPQS
jgi:hypothetical protein